MEKVFTQKDLRCHCGCGFEPKQKLIDKLNQIQKDYEKALSISSGARCSVYNRKIKGARLSAHVEGIAVDISDPNKEFWKWLKDRLDTYNIWCEHPDDAPAWTHFDLRYRTTGRIFRR